MLRSFNFALQRVYIALFLSNILLVTACYGGTNDNDYVAWYNRGIELDDLGRYEEALASFDKALKLKPDYELAQNNRRIVLEELNKLQYFSF